ncbi:hypothetical protein NM208_g17247 [Fusarium decemcellulare]|uniref:Uncharacterized protein n=1 Tax=Fusarium decemcellulare TaxID=57161 RepID=A0ACC1R8F5_9HYPO|nr:hypothetical protein NM208_g17247 [Fusarium decemcellulare]
MMLVVRDRRMASIQLQSVEKAARALNIAVHYVDIGGNDEIIRALPDTIRAINDHLLAIYHSQARSKSQDGKLIVDPSTFRRGKVLFACETGNDRSAAVAAAYIMAVFGKDMVTTVQFICVQRFCCCFDEDIKRKLQSWEDILRARSQVAAQTAMPQQGMHAKRHIEEFMDTDMDEMKDEWTEDRDRFQGRQAFVPFVDM